MPFGIDPVKIAKKELVKVDLDKDKVPDVFEALDVAEAGCEALAGIVGDISADDALVVLKALNGLLPVTSKARRSEADLKLAASGLANLPIALRAAKAALEKVEKELKA